MCGFIGILNQDAVVASQIYEGLLCLQHRGQDAAGMVTFDERFHLKKGNGLVRDIFRTKNMLRLTGPMGIGHVRYPTVGAGHQDDAQPFFINYPYGMAIAHNGNVTNYSALADFLRTQRVYLNSNCDVEIILNLMAMELGRNGTSELNPEQLFHTVDSIFRRVKGSYSVVLLIANYGILAFRDPYGVKPMIYGKQRRSDGSYNYAVASENVALDILGYTDWIDVEPGEVILFRPDLEPASRKLVENVHHPCIFEHVYFARPDSIMDQISVYKTRRRFGEKLGMRIRELRLKIDVVIPVPDSACTAAQTLAKTLGVEYREGLVKNRYIGRTFIMPGQQTRNDNIRRKLNAIPLEFAGKVVLLVDDSIVRGNTSRKIVELARQAGARKVYFASCSPPIRFPCVYGIDMSTRQELIARDRNTEEISRSIGADLLIYQDLGDLLEATRAGNPKIQNFCAACFSGEYPTQDITPEMFSAIEKERLGVHCS
ncbi:MAG: amidophosphoribosyltransferase [Planctomycetota bacterium]